VIDSDYSTVVVYEILINRLFCFKHWITYCINWKL